MNYITTNIRLLEEDYLQLKQEALQKRISFAELVRNKIIKTNQIVQKNRTNMLIRQLEKIAQQNSKVLKNSNGVKLIREMRDNAKW